MKHMHLFNLLLVSNNTIMKTEDGGVVMLKRHDVSIDVLKGTICNKHAIKILHQSNYEFSISSYAIIRCQKITFPYYLKRFFAY